MTVNQAPNDTVHIVVGSLLEARFSVCGESIAPALQALRSHGPADARIERLFERIVASLGGSGRYTPVEHLELAADMLHGAGQYLRALRWQGKEPRIPDLADVLVGSIDQRVAPVTDQPAALAYVESRPWHAPSWVGRDSYSYTRAGVLPHLVIAARAVKDRCCGKLIEGQARVVAALVALASNVPPGWEANGSTSDVAIVDLASTVGSLLCVAHPCPAVAQQFDNIPAIVGSAAVGEPLCDMHRRCLIQGFQEGAGGSGHMPMA